MVCLLKITVYDGKWYCIQWQVEICGGWWHWELVLQKLQSSGWSSGHAFALSSACCTFGTFCSSYPQRTACSLLHHLILSTCTSLFQCHYEISVWLNIEIGWLWKPVRSLSESLWTVDFYNNECPEFGHPSLLTFSRNSLCFVPVIRSVVWATHRW